MLLGETPPKNDVVFGGVSPNYISERRFYVQIFLVSPLKVFI